MTQVHKQIQQLKIQVKVQQWSIRFALRYSCKFITNIKYYIIDIIFSCNYNILTIKTNQIYL